jgi:4-hydroxyproline epimerase
MTELIHIVDSHTAGEPTRVVVSGGPPLGSGTMRERREIFRRDFDCYRAAIVNEPRGSDALVGALLCDPSDASCSAGVIFFNNAGYLNMCGHGTIGVAVTLAHLGRIAPGTHRIETPAGVVEVELHEYGKVTLHNVASYRSIAGLSLDVPGFDKVTGDIAWGGNWFFLTHDCRCEFGLSNIEQLTQYTWAIRQQLTRIGHSEVDHIEVCVGSRSFVLCPGRSYDRSPCGTGTSARLACLYADGKIREGEVWRQESIIGTTFDGWVTVHEGAVYPHIRGSAFVTAEADLILDERDPLRWGIRGTV